MPCKKTSVKEQETDGAWAGDFMNREKWQLSPEGMLYLQQWARMECQAQWCLGFVRQLNSGKRGKNDVAVSGGSISTRLTANSWWRPMYVGAALTCSAS